MARAGLHQKPGEGAEILSTEPLETNIANPLTSDSLPSEPQENKFPGVVSYPV